MLSNGKYSPVQDGRGRVQCTTVSSGARLPPQERQPLPRRLATAPRGRESCDLRPPRPELPFDPQVRALALGRVRGLLPEAPGSLFRGAAEGRLPSQRHQRPLVLRYRNERLQEKGGLLNGPQRLLEQTRLRHRLPCPITMREAEGKESQDRPEVQAAVVSAQVSTTRLLYTRQIASES
jgi:hypothetical protein